MIYLHLLTTLLAGSILSHSAGPIPNYLRDGTRPILPAWQGTYTFPEIAAKLSTNESKILCSPRLSQRAALVHLKSRSRQELQSILSRSLSVEFKPVSSSSPDLLMAPNQVIESRQNRWLVDLKGRMKASMLRLLDGVLSIDVHPEMVPELQVLANRSMDEINLLLRDSKPDFPKIRELAQGAASIGWAINLSTSDDERKLLLEVYRANRSFFIGFPIESNDFKRLPNRPQVSQALQESLLKKRPSLYSRPHWFAARWKFQRQEGCFSLRLDFAAAASGSEIQELGFVLLYFPDIYRDRKQSLRSSATSPTQSVVEVFGVEAKKSLAADFAASSEFLSSSTAKRANLHGTRAIWQTELIDAWAQATESELVMELSVAADGPSYANRSTALSLGDIASPSGDFVFSEYEGVVTVTDAFRFLHGRAVPPVAALVQLERALKQKSVLEDPIRIYPWAELRTYFQRQAEATLWKDLQGRYKLGFRGLSLAEIDEAAVFALLESAIPAVRNAIAAKNADSSIRLTKSMRPQLLQISSKLKGLIPHFALVDDPIQVLLGTKIRIGKFTRSGRTFINLALDDSEGTRWLHLIDRREFTVEAAP